MSRILVIGASGPVGSALSTRLAERGHDVRRASSRPATQPGEVSLDLVTGRGRAEAFTDVDAAFLLSPAGYVDSYALLSPLIDEAATQRLRKVVLMTALGVDADPSTPMRRAELRLHSTGVPFNVMATFGQPCGQH